MNPKNWSIVLLRVGRALAVMAVLVLLLLGVYWYLYRSNEMGDSEMSPDANLAAWEGEEKRYEQAMREDIFGGITPGETIDLLSSALEKEDISLAAKYFVLEDDLNDPDYLTRVYVERTLAAAKERGELSKIANMIRKMRPSAEKSVSAESIDYVLVNEQGEAEQGMTLRFNKFSGRWKVENL